MIHYDTIRTLSIKAFFMQTPQKNAGQLAMRGEFLPQQALAQIETLTAKLKDSKALPPSITNGAQLMMVFLAGYEAGMTPMQSVSSYYIVNGRVTIFGDAVLRQLKQAGFSVEWDERTDKCATVTITDTKKRKHTETFTWEEAVTAGLTHKDVWKKYAKDMLSWKALGRGVRFFCPEVLGGFYMKEEAEDIVPEVVRATDVQVVDVEVSDREAPGANIENLNATWAKLAKANVWSDSQAKGVLGKTLMRYYGKSAFDELTPEEAEDFVMRIEEAVAKKEAETNENQPATEPETPNDGTEPQQDTQKEKTEVEKLAKDFGGKVIEKCDVCKKDFEEDGNPMGNATAIRMTGMCNPCQTK